MRRITFTLAAFLLAALATVPLHRSVEAQEGPEGRILYSRKSGEQVLLHVMNADGTGDRLLPGQTTNVNLFGTWSPDGKRIAFMAGDKADTNEYRVWLADANGGNARQLNTPPGMAGLPAWSPNGEKLALTAGEMLPMVYVGDAEGNNLKAISGNDQGGIGPFWSRDGRKIGFSRFNPTMPKGDLFLTNPDGTGEERLTQGDKLALAGAGAFSPDGKQLLYMAVDPEGDSISLRLLNLADKGETTLADFKSSLMNGPQGLPSPCWSPDGKWILCSMSTDKGQGLFRLSPDGKERKRLTPEGTDCYGGSWIR